MNTNQLFECNGFDIRKSAWYAFLAAAISTPLGMLISFPFIKRIQRSSLGILLDFSAGDLVYIGASHLLPAVERENIKIHAFIYSCRGSGGNRYRAFKEVSL